MMRSGDSHVLADVVVVGGGPAGLNAALVLGRARRRAVVIDEEKPMTNGSRFLTADQLADLEHHRVMTGQDTIAHIESAEGLVQRIILKTGAVIDCEGIFFEPTLVQATSIPASLGCAVSDNGPFST